MQKPQQAVSGGVVTQRERGHAREAVCAGALQRSERERCPNAAAVEIVRDLYRDLGNAVLVDRLDVPCGG